METINHECYVSLEVAKLLKEAGFDWKCEHPYFNGVFDSDSYEPDNFLDTTYQIAAPTLDVAQRWLREVHEMHVYVSGFNNYRAYREGSIGATYLTEVFDTYEAALEAGINKCLTLLLKEE